MTKLSEEARKKAALKHARGKTRRMMEQGRVTDEAEREKIRERARNTPYLDEMRKMDK